MSPANDPAWWTTFFDERYARVGLHGIPDDATGEAVTFITDRFDLRPHDLVFDQCCGVGRLALPLAARGCRVIGVDLAGAYIDRARADADARGLRCTFHQADAHDFVAPEPCDLALNWFSSVGYDAGDERIPLMLRRAFESLRPGGRLAVETVNVARVLAEPRRWHVETVTDERGRAGTLIVEHTLHFDRGMIGMRWTFIAEDGVRDERYAETRMWLPHELGRLVARAGFSDIELIGRPDGEPITASGRRLVVSGRRPS
ncbi:MAG: class I SAM-dependent methyltransferase [Phycisphaerales bacterium]|nr:class I SAM-dependent methyltransferase [Phycisphaerales bacterium]